MMNRILSPTARAAPVATCRASQRSLRAVGLFLVLALIACAPGTVTTSTGAVVPASVVQAQDTTADVLKNLDDAYKAAVAAHDALAPTEDPALHATHRRTLLAMYAGLRGAWDSLLAWKASSTGATPPAVLSSAVTAIRDFVPLAIQLKVLSPDLGAKILGYVNGAFPGGTP